MTAQRNSRDSDGNVGSIPTSDARIREVLSRMEELLDRDEKFRSDVRAGITDLQTRMTRLESEIAGSGGIVGRAVCRERQETINTRLRGVEEQHRGLVTWIRLISVAALGSALTALWAVIRGR